MKIISKLTQIPTMNSINPWINTKTSKTKHQTNDKNEQMASISPKSGTISTNIRSYKSVVSKNARLIKTDFAWQSRFHVPIIRDSKSFENIQNYIAINPANWEKDKFHLYTIRTNYRKTIICLILKNRSNFISLDSVIH
jgi:putative transposase